MGIWASGDRIVPAKLNIGQPYGVNAAAVTSGSDTIPSGTALNTYINMAGTGSVTSFSFTKLNASTRIRIHMAVDLYSVTVVSNAMGGVRINSTDYDIVSLPTSSLSVRCPGSGVGWISGIPAGTYTIQGRWKRTNGTGTMTRDTFSWLSIEAVEVA